MTSTSGGFNVGPSAHSYNPYGIPPTSSTIMPSEQKTQRWNPYINGQNAYITTPMSQYLPNQQVCELDLIYNNKIMLPGFKSFLS